MYITSVLSHLGAWNSLVNEYHQEYQDMQLAVNEITVQKTKLSHERRILLYSPIDITNEFERNLILHGWKTNEEINRIYFSKENRRITDIDAIKGDIGVDCIFGKFSFIESNIFVKFPLFINSKRIKIAFVIVPTSKLSRNMSTGTGNFEKVRDRIKALQPFPYKYKFALVGISDEYSELFVEEITTEIDQYLIERIGYSLLELKLQSEKENCEFKQQLPDDNHQIAKEVSSLANYKSGGVILVGVDNNINIVGVPRNQIDEIDRRLRQICQNSCTPSPTIVTSIFDNPNSSETCVIAFSIQEIRRKPCITREKVYVRAGPLARPANPDEIREMLLGDSA